VTVVLEGGRAKLLSPRVLVVCAALLLSACGGQVERPTAVSRPAPVARPVPATPIPAVPSLAVQTGSNAAGTGFVLGPPLASLPLREEDAVRAVAAFRMSCASLQRRTDTSGLTRGTDWQAACSAAPAVAPGAARAFFAQYFEAVQIADGKAFATGYYEPEIAASRQPMAGYTVPIYGRPGDLIDVDLSLFSESLKGRKIRGRVSGSNFVPYDDRTAIEQGTLNGRAPIIAYAADPVALFFLQVQGSGRLRMPDGAIVRIGYTSQNGRDYTGIGALMKRRGLLGPGQTSMQGIVAWLHAHPDEATAIMRENKSYVFFREQASAPQGALGVAVTGGVSAAADPKFVPLGAPVLLSMDRADASRLWIAQDTGGAIKGPNRIDTFWGAGPDAEATAGGMSARGTAFLLLPTGTVARLTQERANGTPIPQP
jgi:membrane-bound lytic murein transglycosylase A